MDSINAFRSLSILVLQKVHAEGVLSKFCQQIWIFLHSDVKLVIFVGQMNLKSFLQHFFYSTYLPNATIIYIYFIADLKLLPVPILSYLYTIHRPLILVELHFDHVNIAILQNVISLIYKIPFIICYLISAFHPESSVSCWNVIEKLTNFQVNLT